MWQRTGKKAKYYYFWLKNDESTQEQEPSASFVGDSTLQYQPDPSRQQSAVQRFGSSADIRGGALRLARSLARYQQQ